MTTMTERITAAQLRSTFEHLKDRALAAGVTEAARWHLTEGSKTYGNAFGIWLAHPDYERAMRGESPDPDSGWSAHYSPLVNDRLGMTKAEAWETMRAMISAFNAVVWAREEANR